jgi:hypothetical protein
MKHLFTLLIMSLLCGYASMAQILPNAGFETWEGTNFPEPVGWNGTDESTSSFGVSGTIQQSNEAHTGNFALRSEAKYLAAFSRIVPGLCTTGEILLIEEEVINGPAYTQRPDSLAGWYKFTRTNSDTMFIQLVLLDANDDTVGFANYWNITSTSTYKRFSQAIDYHSGSNPTYGHVIIRHSTSNSANPVGSIMWIDDLEVVFPAGIEDNVNKPRVKIYPNPAEKYVMLDNPTGQDIELAIYDAIGRRVEKKTISGEQQRIDVQHLVDGVYFAEIKQNDKVIKVEKLVVQH